MGYRAMKMGAVGVAAMGCLVIGGAALAWQVAPNASDINQIVGAAKSGATITLPRGNYGPLVISNKNFDKPVTIIADAATIESIVIRRSSNIVRKMQPSVMHCVPTNA